MHDHEFDLLADAVRQNLPGARREFDLLVRPIVRHIVERKLRRELRRNGRTLPSPEFADLVHVGVSHLYDALLDFVLRSPTAETVPDSRRVAHHGDRRNGDRRN